MLISQYFKKEEFDCSCGCKMPDQVFVQVILLANSLDYLRRYFNSPLFISSGYRCVSHNSRVKGAKKSYHIKGKAADIYFRNIPPKKVEEKLKDFISVGMMPSGGLKSYKNFTHYDQRGHFQTW